MFLLESNLTAHDNESHPKACEFISHPGRQDYIPKLSSTLNNTMNIVNNLPRCSELVDEDLDKTLLQADKKQPVIQDGTDANTVDLAISSIETSGGFQVNCTQKGGSPAEYSFEGMKEGGERAVMHATATQQTESTTMNDIVDRASLQTSVDGGTK